MKYRPVVLVALVTLAFPLTSHAASNTWSANVAVPDHCTVTDDSGVSHDYSGQYLGICALETAITNGSVSGVQFSNAYPSLGLFVTSIEGVTADPSSQYWALYQDGSYANAGLSQLPVAAGDTLVLELHDFSDTFLGDRLTITIDSLVKNVPPPAAAGNGGLTLHDPFNVAQALNFLWSKQGADGSFGSSLLDDWVAIASAKGGAGDMQAHLAQHEFTHPPMFSNVTDYERHAMALEALGVNPYEGPADYITPIVTAFDGTQIGDPKQDNDDIFALFPLLHAGYTARDAIIASTTAFIISRQQPDGSWDESVDMTAAAVQALALVPSLPGAPDATEKALAYLHHAQKDDGGFGDPSATSWVLQAVYAIGQSPVNWSVRGTYLMPDYYLATKQEVDGGIGPISAGEDQRVWATAYAIPAIERKPWNSLLANFSKPATAFSSLAATSSPLATSTPHTATTTPEKSKVLAPTVPLGTRAVSEKTRTQKPATSLASSTMPAIATSSRPRAQAAAAATVAPPSWLHEALAIFFPWFF